MADVAGNELALLDGESGHFWPSGPLALTATANGLVRLWDLRRLPASSAAAAVKLWLWGVPVAELAALARTPGADRRSWRDARPAFHGQPELTPG